MAANVELDLSALEAGLDQPLLTDPGGSRVRRPLRQASAPQLSVKYFHENALVPLSFGLAVLCGPPVKFDITDSLLFDLSSFFILLFVFIVFLGWAFLILSICAGTPVDRKWLFNVWVMGIGIVYWMRQVFPYHLDTFFSNGGTWFYAPLELYSDLHSPDVEYVCTNITANVSGEIQPLYQDGMLCGSLMNPFFLHWRPIMWGLFSWGQIAICGWNWSTIVRTLSPQMYEQHPCAARLAFLPLTPMIMICNLPQGLIQTNAIARVIYVWMFHAFRRIHTVVGGDSSVGGDGQPESIRISDIGAVLLVVWWLTLPWPKFDSLQSHIPMATDDMIAKVVKDKSFHAKFKKKTSFKLLRHASSLLIGAKTDTKSLEEKRNHIREDSKSDADEKIETNRTAPHMFSLSQIRREHLLEDSLKSLKTANTFELLAPTFYVSFKDEQGVDAGGVTRDWFNSMAQMLAKGSDEEKGESLFRTTSDGTLLPRNTGLDDNAEAIPDELKPRFVDLFTAGRFLAVAVLRKFPLPIAFGTVLMKTICDEEIDSNDVRRLDPDFYRVRVNVIMKEGGVAEMNAMLGEPLVFMSAAEETVEPKKLKDGGDTLQVTEENKREYAALLCEAHLCNGIRKELATFLAGFHEVLSLVTLHANDVTHVDLSLLISGLPTLDVEDWKQHSGFVSNDISQWFWEVLAELSDEQKAKLLQFATGSSRVPPGGFKDLKPQFKITMTQESGEHLPHSHTCFNQLMLASYESKEQLKTKVIGAIDVGEIAGFGFA